MKNALISVYGAISYIVGLSGLMAFMLYMGGWSFLPVHINSKEAASTSLQAVMINMFIMLAFGLHHSIAARRGFKEKLARIIPPEMERSTYVLVSGLFMYAICFYWQPLAGTLWSIDNAAVVITLKAIHVLGWVVLVAATFEIDHFHLMGLKQSFTMNPAEGNELKERFLYRIVRHPIQTGILMGVWSTAQMSATQFMLSACLTIYIFIGLHFEERSLESRFGDVYRDYKKRVPGVIPFWPCKR